MLQSLRNFSTQGCEHLVLDVLVNPSIDRDVTALRACPCMPGPLKCKAVSPKPNKNTVNPPYISRNSTGPVSNAQLRNLKRFGELQRSRQGVWHFTKGPGSNIPTGGVRDIERERERERERQRERERERERDRERERERQRERERYEKRAMRKRATAIGKLQTWELQFDARLQKITLLSQAPVCHRSIQRTRATDPRARYHG